MSSTPETNFEQILIGIAKDLRSHHSSREEFISKCVNERLSKSLSNYFNELEKTKLYLEYREEKNLLKKYERVMK